MPIKMAHTNFLFPLSSHQFLAKDTSVFGHTKMKNIEHIGIAVKDDSLLNINNTIISNCSKGIFSYKKNWRYNNAGTINSNNVKFINNDLDTHINETGKFYHISDKIQNIKKYGNGIFINN